MRKYKTGKEKSIPRTLLAMIAVGVAMVALFCLLGWVSTSMPRAWIADNVVRSAHVIVEDEKEWCHGEYRRPDYFTDALMLDIAISSPNPGDDCFADFLSGRHYIWLPLPASAADHAELTARANSRRISEDEAFLNGYTRYWHGYVVPLRILLCLTDIRGIRVMNYILLWSLAAVCCVLMWRRMSWMASLSFTLAMLFGMIPVPASMQYSTCFYVMLLSLLLFLLFPSLIRNRYGLCLSMFVIGGVTSFLDFLVTPVITLGLPLAVAVWFRPVRSRLRMSVYGMFSWGSGYAMIWSSKWIVATLYTGVNIFKEAVYSIQERTYDFGEFHFAVYSVFLFFVALCAVCAVFVLFALLLTRRNSYAKSCRYLLLIGALPLFWYMILMDHSVVHWWFTWRSMVVSVFCWSLYLFAAIASGCRHELNKAHKNMLSSDVEML